jgi:hypothetical protein
VNNQTRRALSRLGFLSVGGIDVQNANTQFAELKIVREPHPNEYLNAARYTFKPWFWWIINCPHDKLWQQPCGQCKLTRAERNVRAQACVRVLSK